jgi:tetratricopeptide (TPR) repeat protein
VLGVAAANARRYAEGVRCLGRAVAAAPARAEYLAQLARCLVLARREGEALGAVERALALEPRDAPTLDTLGVVLTRAGRHAQAAALFRRAVAAAPENAGFQYNLASSLRFVGDAAGAEQAFEAVVRLAPRHYAAHAALAELVPQSPEANHIDRLLRLLAEVGDDVDGELRLRHALAKEYEDLGDYDCAFRHLAAGRAKKRATLGYRFADDRALFERIRAVCDREFSTRRAEGAPSREPIFVVGMPRTGTTLVDRILSSHSAVVSAGELHNFSVCLKRAAGTGTPRTLDPETLAAAAGLDFRAVGERYLESVRPFRAADAGRFVDKLPLNFLLIGFIRRALPRAKIVCLRRHPLDTCLGNFRQLFALGFAYYAYAYDLDDIAEYYIEFDRLMRHWEEVLPGVVLRVDYEALVTNQEAETRRLLEFCDLPWEAGCLDFAANTAPVASASATQVRQPLNRAAIGRWRRYEDALAGVRERLLAAGIAVAADD